MLPGLDHLDGGIHYETARILCAIIADNQYAGFFTEDSAGPRRVETPKDGVLQPKNYTFNTTIFIKFSITKFTSSLLIGPIQHSHFRRRICLKPASLSLFSKREGQA